ncbi:MAG: serine protease, partial [Tateyamaria sp.]
PPRNAVTLPEGTALPGLQLAQVNPAVLTELNLPISAEGVVVLDEGPIGRRVGLRRGDLLQRIDRRDVSTPDQAADLLADARRGTTVRAIRGNRRIVLRF